MGKAVVIFPILLCEHSSSVFTQALISEPVGEEKPGESWSACTHRHWHSVLFLNESIFKPQSRAVVSI